MNQQDLLNFLKLLQGFVPGVKFTGIDTIQDLKLAENINISINFGTISNQNKPLAIITPINYKNKSLENSVESINESIAFLPNNTSKGQKIESGNNIKLDIQKIPFSSGINLIINQKDWWKKKGNSEEKSVLIGDLKLIPLCENEWGYIKTIESEQQFGLSINQDGSIKAEIWRGNLPPIDIKNLSPDLLETFEFTEYKAGEVMKFETLPELVVSLNEKVVKKAILVEYYPKNSLKEYFVFILAQE